MPRSLVHYSVVDKQHDKILIVGSGESALQFDVDTIPKDWVCIAVNNAITLTGDFTKYWFTVDPSKENREIMIDKPVSTKICTYYAAVPKYYGTPYDPISIHQLERPRNIKYLSRFEDSNNKLSMAMGLSEKTYEIHTGNSAYGALGLAYHMKPKQIVLLGVDATVKAKFDGKRSKSLDHLDELFSSALPQMNKRGIEVVNASVDSNLTCFKKMTLLESIVYIG